MIPVNSPLRQIAFGGAGATPSSDWNTGVWLLMSTIGSPLRVCPVFESISTVVTMSSRVTPMTLSRPSIIVPVGPV